MTTLPWFDADDDETPFPDVELALRDPDGLLAVGGSLSQKRLMAAYHRGIFPWFNNDQPILWWSPDPRTVLFPERIKISRSLRKTLRKRLFTITLDQAFEQVIEACAEPAPGREGTWITADMKAAYCHLHDRGIAHSVEAWHEGRLVGGLYGVALGRVFFGESMFSRMANASKVAFVHLVRQLQAWDYALIDCQVYTAHLVSLGAEEIPRRVFTALLDQWCEVPGQAAPWQLSDTVIEALSAPSQDRRPHHTATSA